jgi:hypothetical protein
MGTTLTPGTIIPAGSPLANQLDNEQGSFSSNGFTFGSPQGYSTSSYSGLPSVNTGGMATLSQIQSLPDPALQWMWTLDILNVAGLGANISNLYVHDVSIPLMGLDSEPRFRAGILEHFPRHAGSYSMNVTFYEDGNFTVSQILNNWHKLIRNDTKGSFGYPISYMGQAVARLYDTAGNNNMTVQLYAVWPLRRGNLDLHYQSSQNLTVQCEFSVNVSLITFNGSQADNPYYGNVNFNNIPSTGSTTPTVNSSAGVTPVGSAQPTSTGSNVDTQILQT